MMSYFINNTYSILSVSISVYHTYVVFSLILYQCTPLMYTDVLNVISYPFISARTIHLSVYHTSCYESSHIMSFHTVCIIDAVQGPPSSVMSSD